MDRHRERRLSLYRLALVLAELERLATERGRLWRQVAAEPSPTTSSHAAAITARLAELEHEAAAPRAAVTSGPPGAIIERAKLDARLIRELGGADDQRRTRGQPARQTREYGSALPERARSSRAQ